ncbi:hypothetical protein RRG08_037528 [Elysia crispata]|uniref:Uncharacterized protein n=1 Tax=Elysia crispata TaxID=231223 RepID=A0AAE1A3M9_9GAST|nr:hypothetical protein RRG08_037528 [Elysia crispata]
MSPTNGPSFCLTLGPAKRTLGVWWTRPTGPRLQWREMWSKMAICSPNYNRDSFQECRADRQVGYTIDCKDLDVTRIVIVWDTEDSHQGTRMWSSFLSD